jgi:hypothetical protein
VPSTRDRILAGLETFLEGVLRFGGDGDLSFAEPLAKAPKGMPPGAADVFTKISRHIKVSWTFDEDVDLPDAFEECMFGELDLHPKCFDVVTPKWSVADEPVWKEKTLFAPDGSGDYLGIDGDGRIVFLSHDLDEHHGMVLADGLLDLLKRWAPLGFVGPAGVALLPFMRKKRLDPDGPAAKRFLKIVGGSSRNWKRAKKQKYDAIENQKPQGLDALVRQIADPKLDETWAGHHDYVLNLIKQWYGRGPSPALQTLISHAPGKAFGPFQPMPPGGVTISWTSAFSQACADVHLLAGALTNTWPIGSSYLAEVSPEADEVSLRKPLLGFVGVSESLEAFARQLHAGVARKNTALAEPPPPKATRAAALAEQGKMLRALLEQSEASRHLVRLSPTPLPADFAALDCARALQALLLCFLSGAPLSPPEHPALLVRDAAVVLASLQGRDPRHPANFLWLAREICTGATALPEEHDDEEQLVNRAHAMKAEKRWSDMLAIADEMIARGFRLDHAWPYRVDALAALGRHEEVLAAADMGLLFCSLGSAALFGAKLTALAALGETEASEAHLFWCSPHYRTHGLKR